MQLKSGPGDMLPDIALQRADGGAVAIGDFAGKRAVLFFYPKAATPGCTREAQDFSALRGEFDAAGVALLGVSKDSPARLRAFAERYALTVDLASDTADPGLSDALGIWGEKQLYGRRFMGMHRTTYLIGADGMIARMWTRVKVAGHAAEVLAAATA